MVKTSDLKYPNKSHRKKINLPEKSDKLAEFFGIMMGDGGINNPWQANISLNSVSDASYSSFVSDLCVELFNIRPTVRKRKGRNTLVLSLTSTTLVDFLVDNGLPRGNKIRGGLSIPEWILCKESYRKASVRGLLDTDGCIFVHKHCVGGKEYRNIGLTFTSYADKLLYQVAQILEESAIMPHISNEGRSVYLYRAEDVSRYLEIFGTSNDRIVSVYKKWRDARVV